MYHKKSGEYTLYTMIRKMCEANHKQWKFVICKYEFIFFIFAFKIITDSERMLGLDGELFQDRIGAFLTPQRLFKCK